MRKLFTAGCSVSIRNGCETSFPEELAKLLNYDLINLSAGCGSNFRIWRTITKHIIDGTLTSDDIAVIQYTEPIRREFYSRFPIKSQPNMEDSYDNGKIIRYKIDAHTWQPFKEEQDFFKLYEENFINENFENENFETNNFNFQIMLETHKIKAIFIKTSRIAPKLNWYMGDTIKNYVFYDYSNNNNLYNLSLIDKCHFSDIGHKLMAKNLYEHILNLKLNEQ